MQACESEKLVETLTESGVYRDYEEAFSAMTGLPLALRSAESWRLPFRGKRRESPLCAMMAERSRTCAVCLRTQETLAQQAAEFSATVECPYGLNECAVPVGVDGSTIGFLQTGQFLPQEPSELGFAAFLSAAREFGAEFNPAAARRAYFATPVVSRAKREAVLGLLKVFADHLGQMAHQISVRAAHAEPEAIRRAKDFIEQHHAESLSLDRVSRAVHMNLYSLCKQFHKAEGMTFTEFVTKTRVDKAKNFLLNPHLRISDIAYQVGFQSLTHFNRTFKCLVGESPTRYRNHLPGRTSNQNLIS